MSDDEELLEFVLEYLHHTDDAVKVKTDYGKDLWIPKSLMKDLEIDIDRKEVVFSINYYYAYKNGLI